MYRLRTNDSLNENRSMVAVRRRVGVVFLPEKTSIVMSSLSRRWVLPVK